MSLNFKQWIHEGIKHNPSYYFFVKSPIYLREQLEDPSSFTRLKQKELMANMALHINVECDHRIMQYATKIANLSLAPSSPVQGGGAGSEQPQVHPIFLNKKEKSLLPTQTMGSIKSPQEEFQEECRTYIKKFPKIDDVQVEDKKINYYECLIRAAEIIYSVKKIRSRDDIESIVFSMLSLEEGSYGQPKHDFKNLFFGKTKDSPIFNRFHDGSFDSAMMETIRERNKDVTNINRLESKWTTVFQKLFKLQRREKGQSKYERGYEDFSKVADFAVSKGVQPTSSMQEPDSDTLSSGEIITKRQDEIYPEMTKKVEEIIQRIKNRTLSLPYDQTGETSSINYFNSKNNGEIYRSAIIEATRNLKSQVESPQKLSSFLKKFLLKKFEEANKKAVTGKIFAALVKIYKDILNVAAEELAQEDESNKSIYLNAAKAATTIGKTAVARGQFKI